VAIGREHEPIVAALDRGDAATAGALLKSHSTDLVEYLRAQAVDERDGSAPPPKPRGGKRPRSAKGR